MRWGLAFYLLMSTSAFAVARPWHDHQDLFGESDLQIGFKAGPELTSYTAIQQGSTVLDVQPAMRFVAGGAVKFIYGFPRVEADFFWNARGGINTSDTYNALAVPVLVKAPIELDKYVDFEFGAGMETDQVMFGADPHRTWMFGVVASAGLSIDFKTWLFEFEGRYNVGIQNIADNVNGGRPRDLQILSGVLWHF